MLTAVAVVLFIGCVNITNLSTYTLRVAANWQSGPRLGQPLASGAFPVVTNACGSAGIGMLIPYGAIQSDFDDRSG